MANGSTPHTGARGDDHPATRRLRELAAQEAAVTKQRLATRTAAARLFFGAVARLAEAKAAWGRAQAEARRAQAEAVEDLVGSGLQLGEVAELLGISNQGAAELGRRDTSAAEENEAVQRTGRRRRHNQPGEFADKARRERGPKTGGAALW